MMVREKVGAFDYQSGKSQGIVREFGYEPCYKML